MKLTSLTDIDFQAQVSLRMLPKNEFGEWKHRAQKIWINRQRLPLVGEHSGPKRIWINGQ